MTGEYVFGTTKSGVNTSRGRLEREYCTARTLPVRTERLVFAAILLAAAILRFATLGHDSLWIDEGYTLASAGHSFGHIFTVPFDSHPPLHFAVVKLFTLMGDGEWALRAPSALFATLTLVPVYFLARRAFGPVGALVTIACLALSYTHLVYANNGRNYAMVMFFLMTSALAVLHLTERLLAGDTLIKRPALGWMALYLASAIAALYTHNTAILYLFAINAAACAYVLSTAPRRTVSFTLRLGAVNAPALIIWIPWLMVMLSTSEAFGWLGHTSPVEAARTLAAMLGPNSVAAPLVVVYFLAVGAGIALALSRLNWTTVLILLHIAAFPALIWLIGFVYKPIYMERIILPALIAGPLAIGVLAAHARRPWLAVALPGLALLASLVSAGAYIFRGETETNLSAHVIQDWRSAVADHDAVGDVLIICDTFTWPTVAAYASQADILVNQERGLWALTPQGWRDNYGRPVSQRMLKRTQGEPDWMIRAHRDWQSEMATHNTVVFLKPDMLCNDGEPERLRARLSKAGFQPQRTDTYRGIRAEVWQRPPL
jgi:4-amino-4-deoxy-L-arabinose transferase-like glycosyltransferase